MRKRLFVTLLCACMCFGTGCSETDSNKTNVETTVNETTTIAATELTTIKEFLTTQEETTTREAPTTTDYASSKYYSFPSKQYIEENKTNFVYSEVSRNPEKYEDYYYKIPFYIYQKCLYDDDDIDYYYKAYDQDGNEIWLFDFRSVCKDADKSHVLEGDTIIAYGCFIGYMDTVDTITGINSEILTFSIMYCDIIQ